MNYLKNNIALSLAQTTLINVLSRHPLHKHFKVGKTIQALQQRFAEDYADEYEGIEVLYDSGADGELMDWLEVEMIKYCRSTYGDDECDNRQEGGGPDCKDKADCNNTAKLYVVWR